MMRRRFASVFIWIALLGFAAIIAARARYTADLSAFLPKAPSPAQQFLVEQLRDGLAAKMLLVDIEGADAPTRATLSRQVAASLRAGSQFRSVLNGEADGRERDRAFVFGHRYVLSDRVVAGHFFRNDLRAAVADGLDTLASPVGLVAKDLFVRDPTGETLQVLAQLESGFGEPRRVAGVWASPGGRRALLVAETRARGSDTDGQEQAIAAVQVAFAAAVHALPPRADAPAVLRLTGPGYFAVTARAAIEHEAVWLSVASASLIFAFLFLVYRSLPLLMFGLLPVISGALAGVAAVALGFGVVHGVTLGFGVTLIGEAVDYSVYFFLQAGPAGTRGARTDWTATLWPTIRLGMLSSICGFMSLLPSAFPGLAQLGLYSIAGLVAAGLVTRYVLPQLMPVNLALPYTLPLGHSMERALRAVRWVRPALWLLALAAGVILVLAREHLWSRELSALSPVSAAEQVLDGELRADLGAPDVRTLAVVTGKTTESVLQAAESVGRALDPLVAAGVIAGYQSPTRYLPSLATQRARRSSLPPGKVLAAELRAAVSSLPVSAERLRPFLADVEAARTGELVKRADLEGTALASAVDSLLVPHGDGWSVWLPLQAVRTGTGVLAIDVAQVERALGAAATPGVEATVLDLKVESDVLYDGYLSAALRLSLAGLVAIVALLLVSLRSVARVTRVVAPLLLAVLTVLAGFALLGRQLTILHLIGLLLTVAIGSNYALFFDRQTADPESGEHARMLASLLVANLTTVIAFGVLSLATVPVLSALGSTVAPGALLALVYSALLARPNAGHSRDN